MRKQTFVGVRLANMFKNPPSDFRNEYVIIFQLDLKRCFYTTQLYYGEIIASNISFLKYQQLLNIFLILSYTLGDRSRHCLDKVV